MKKKLLMVFEVVISLSKLIIGVCSYRLEMYRLIGYLNPCRPHFPFLVDLEDQYDHECNSLIYLLLLPCLPFLHWKIQVQHSILLHAERRIQGEDFRALRVLYILAPRYRFWVQPHRLRISMRWAGGQSVVARLRRQAGSRGVGDEEGSQWTRLI